MIKSTVAADLMINLLSHQEFARFSSNPSLLSEMCSSLKQKSIVVIDEIQKIPELLNEVHLLIEEKNLRFVLTGSSARKLKKGGANLLAGRALTRNLPAFAKFLEVMAIQSGEELFLEGIANHTEIKAKTISNYIEILEDTLLGFTVPAFQETKKEKQFLDQSFICLM